VVPRERGAQGWTVGNVHGASLEGVREGASEADRTIELKLICNSAVADTIAEHATATYQNDKGRRSAPSGVPNCQGQ
jgi:hypothetical protein